TARRGRPPRRAGRGGGVVGGRRPGASELAKPGVSANIWARLPRQNPSPGMTGELCSQPPLGVAETMLPNRSGTSRWQVSPGPNSGAEIAEFSTVGSPVPALDISVTPKPASANSGSRGAIPSGDPGSSSPEAHSPTSLRRASAYGSDSSPASGTA